jgi:hypothetical protein
MSRFSSAFADTLRACNAEPESDAVHQQKLMFFNASFGHRLGSCPGAQALSVSSAGVLIGGRRDRSCSYGVKQGSHAGSPAGSLQPHAGASGAILRGGAGGR